MVGFSDNETQKLYRSDFRKTYSPSHTHPVTSSPPTDRFGCWIRGFTSIRSVAKTDSLLTACLFFSVPLASLDEVRGVDGFVSCIDAIPTSTWSWPPVIGGAPVVCFLTITPSRVCDLSSGCGCAVDPGEATTGPSSVVVWVGQCARVCVEN